MFRASQPSVGKSRGISPQCCGFAAFSPGASAAALARFRFPRLRFDDDARHFIDERERRA